MSTNNLICNIISVIGLVVMAFGLGLMFFHFVSALMPTIGLAMMIFGQIEND